MASTTQIIKELRRRDVFRTGAAYLVVAWLLVQVSDILLGAFAAPAWALRGIIFALAVGFPIALVLAWVYEITSQGIKRTAGDSTGELVSPHAGRQLDFAIIGVLMVAVLLFAADKFRWVDFGLGSSVAIRSVAVLPLDNLSGDQEQQYFTDGMHEALIAELGQLGAIDVISRTSSMLYRNTDKSAPEIASELGVDALIEGSVLRVGDDVRITLQFIDARTDAHLFARSFERKLEDILSMQASVARAVTEAIEVSLTPEAEARLASTRTVNPEAYDLWLRGNYFLDAQSPLDPESSQRALDAFQGAVALAPDYAPAYAGMALSYLNLGGWWSPLSPKEYFPQALEAANQAVELDRDLADAHFVLGRIRGLYLWDWGGAQAAFARAMALEPTDASNGFGMGGYANFLTAMGRYDEAIEVARRAVEIEPFAFWAHSEIAFALVMAGRHDEALMAMEDAMELMPSHFDANVVGKVFIYLAIGDKERAEELLPPVNMVKESFNINAVGWIAYCYARVGRQPEAQDLRDYLLTRRSQGYVSEHLIALAYLGIGEQDEALEWLERGIDERDSMAVWLKEHFVYDELRSDPRFQKLLGRMSFPED